MVLDSDLVANKIIEDWLASTFRFDALKKNVFAVITIKNISAVITIKNVSALITIKNAFKRFCNDYY